MGKRCVWVVEASDPVLNGWCVWSSHDTREEARREKADVCIAAKSRVVKYVPAESGKKGGVK